MRDSSSNSDSSSNWYDSDDCSSNIQLQKQKRAAERKTQKTVKNDVSAKNDLKLDPSPITSFEQGKIYVGDASEVKNSISRRNITSKFMRIEVRGREEDFTIHPLTLETRINTNCFNIDYQYECYAKDTGEHLKLMKRQIYEIQNFDENVKILEDQENTETFKHTNSIVQNHQACFIRDRKPHILRVCLDDLVPCEIRHDYTTTPNATPLLDTQSYDETKFTENGTKEFKKLIEKYNSRINIRLYKDKSVINGGHYRVKLSVDREDKYGGVTERQFSTWLLAKPWLLLRKSSDPRFIKGELVEKALKGDVKLDFKNFFSDSDPEKEGVEAVVEQGAVG